MREPRQERAVTPPRVEKKKPQAVDVEMPAEGGAEEEEDEVDDDAAAMAAMMGFGGFETTKVRSSSLRWDPGS